MKSSFIAELSIQDDNDMESQNIGPSPPGNSLAISEFEHDGLATQCEGDEDLELIHMGQNDNEPISPNLKAVMEKDKKSDRPQEARPAPLLLERPQSSGLDVAGFSFGKPGPCGRPLLLQSLRKRPCSAPRNPPLEQTSRRGMTDQARHQDQVKFVPPMLSLFAYTDCPLSSISPATHKPRESETAESCCNSAESDACRNTPMDPLHSQRAQDGASQTAGDMRRIATTAGNPSG